MRVLQLIDTLEVGGAETLAVNYANALSEKIDFSGLVTTRSGGVLKKNLDEKVVYDCIEKRNTLDVKALFKLKRIVSDHDIKIIHAHGTSYFTATLLKIFKPKLKIIWHEHYGARVNQKWISNFFLLICSLLFRQIFVVNFQLKEWMRQNLFTKNVEYIPNYAVFPRDKQIETSLFGKTGKRIVCLANLKNPKNHLFLLRAFYAVKSRTDNFDWSLHLIGKDFNDAYSDELKEYIQQQNLQKEVFIYGLKTDVEHILSQAEIGVLASTDEGFPVSLLEFLLSKIPVVSTNAGYCSSIVKDNVTGLLFNPTEVSQLENQLQVMISSAELRETFRNAIDQHSAHEFSEEKVIALLISKYNSL